MLKAKNLRISALESFLNMTDPEKRVDNSSKLISVIDAAALLGTDVVCAMEGSPVPGKDRMQTIEEDVPAVYVPILQHAEEKGIKIALENWVAGTGYSRSFSQVLPNENFGLNFDPSHLLWQDIDYILAVDRFADRIFHVHAKDTEVIEHRLKYWGNQSSQSPEGWWRCCIPGYGKIKWGQFIAALRRNGYNNVLSIEHEDSALGREEGFIKAIEYLRQFA